MDFLKIDLALDEQPAIARLSEKISFSGNTIITQARFGKFGVTITRFNAENETEQFFLNPEELDFLCGFAGLYDALRTQHTVAIAERKEQIIAEAKALAQSVQFDLESLNVRAKRDGDNWHVVIGAFAYEHRCSSEHLKVCVQEALDYIKREAESAESESEFYELSPEWKAIVASYRRTYPKKAGQGELPPEAITAIEDLSAAIREASEQYIDPETIIAQARELLNNSAHPSGWALEHVGVNPQDDRYSFDNGQEGEKHFALLNKTAAKMLNEISAYLIDNNFASAQKGPDDWDDLTKKPLKVTVVDTIDDETVAPFGAFTRDC